MKKWHIDALLLAGLIFLIVGLVFLTVGGANWMITERFAQGAVPVEGVIERIDFWGDDMEVHVRYTYEGREYYEELEVYTSGMREGNPIALMIHPFDPDDPRAQGQEYLFSIIFLGMGGLFTLLGGSFTFVRLRARKLRRQLLDMGRRLEATITGASVNPYVRVNGRHPWKVECADASGRRYTSDNIYARCDGLIGRKVDVYVHPLNDEKYYVDVESALE